MDEKRYSKLQFVVESAWGIEIDTDFLSADYAQPKFIKNAETTKTGHLELCRIEPLRAGLPSFSARWDRDDDVIDVDLEGNSSDRRSFAKRSPGFEGHKTKKISDDPRTHRVAIKLPTGDVFRGTITLRGLGLGLRLQGQITLTGECRCELIRANDQTTD